MTGTRESSLPVRDPVGTLTSCDVDSRPQVPGGRAVTLGLGSVGYQSDTTP